uniref:protein acetyllysine N-acetyltransferase n=1 Tax=Syphacia muris TaxID=451379 RepID=A0A0N5AWM8_9BILA
MSLNYAESLSPYDNKGRLGLPEVYDDVDTLKNKVVLLAEWLRKSKCCVVHTGAGISTSAGIADFRSPNGVWTLQKQNKTAKSIDFNLAKPTFSHRALNALEAKNLVKFVVTQNVDGLHVRAGYPLNRLAELHGNVFVERCDKCRRKYYRDFVVGSVGFKKTGRKCEGNKNRPCRGSLRDELLNWEDELPEDELQMARSFSQAADLSICLGTTLQIVPAGDLPLHAHRNGGKFVTVNLQETKHEKKADLIIKGKIDEVMKLLMEELGIPVPDPQNDVKIVEESSFPVEKFKRRRLCK